MSRRSLTYIVAAAVALAASTSITAAPRSVGGENEVKLSGCLVRGDGDGAGYLLTNAPAEPTWLNPSDGRVAPNAVGTAGGFTTVFYWLDGHGDLKTHIGHRVEIEGELKGNLKEGEIEVERKDQWTEVSVKADGRNMKYNVPHTSIVANPDRDKRQKSDILVRRVAVEKVTMMSASCTP